MFFINRAKHFYKRKFFSGLDKDAVESLVKAIESKDRIVLGNSVAFVGASVPEKLTVVGNGTVIMNSTLGFSKKNQDKGFEPIVKISSRL